MTDEDSLYNGIEEVQETIPGKDEVKEPEPTGEEAQASEEKATEDKTEEAAASPPETETESSQRDSRQVPIEALLDEREKRQLEARRREDLEKQIESNKEKLDLFEDPDKFMGAFASQIEARADKRFMDLSESLAAQRFDDYGDMKELFLTEIAPQSPAVMQQVQFAADPAGEMHKIASAYQQLKGVGDVDELTKKIREEERAKLKAELESKSQEDKEKLDDIPESLSETPSAGGPSEVFNVPSQEELYN